MAIGTPVTREGGAPVGEGGERVRMERDVVRSIPSSPLSHAPLHFDIFRPAKLRLAAQKMICAPGGVPGGPME